VEVLSDKPLIVVVGPTAVGKTNLAIELAKKYNSQIVSADSMQIYKYMDIGTAKPSLEEKQMIKHYLIDEIEPNQEFSVAAYKQLADKYIELIFSQGKIPILVGGTGLYINSVINNISFSETICDWEYRNFLNATAIEKGNYYIWDMLNNIDPKSAQKLHENDTRRVIRALEVYKYTGIPMSTHQEDSRKIPSSYNLVYIGLNMDRERLYERINKRVDIMIAQGLIDEVKELISRGYTKEMQSMKAIGYKEIIQYIEGEVDLTTAVENLKRESRRYAKRQLTWFRKDERIKWFDIDKDNYDITEKIYSYANQQIYRK